MNTQRKTAERITWGVTAAVAVAGVVMSADQLVHLAQLAGWAGGVRWLLPILLDGSGIAGGLAYKFAATAGARRWGLVVLIESAALSVFGNVSAHMITEVAAPMWVAAVVAVAVPLQIVLTVHMGILLSDQPADQASAETRTETAPAVAATPTATETATPAAPTETTPAPVETPAVSVGGETVTGESAAPLPDVEPQPTQPLPRLRAVPPQQAADGLADPAEGADTEGGDLDGPGGIQNAMWNVYATHAEAGTAAALSGAQLAREAGVGSRQLAGRYLAKWRRGDEWGALA